MFERQSGEEECVVDLPGGEVAAVREQQYLVSTALVGNCTPINIMSPIYRQTGWGSRLRISRLLQ